LNEIQLLLGKSLKAINSASVLLKEDDFEGSVSRSYYSMFYAAETILITKDIKFSSHRSVISLLGENFIKTGLIDKEMGKNIHKSFEKRLLSDYSFDVEIGKEDAQEVLETARKFFVKTREYLIKENIIDEELKL
jgi:uncharacterized protein (UPF0332 family)